MSLEITDVKLKQSVDRFFEKLEKYFPEHKVFALDSIDKNLRERLAELYKKVGCATAEEFLAEYGFEIISGDEIRKIRSFVIYTPGNEPEIIKSKVDSMLKRLKEYYPDFEIKTGMQTEHKSLSQDISGLYKWLGYENNVEMLEAYGFNVQYSDGGRPSNDYQGLIDTLKEKYKDDDKKLKSIGLLKHDNPELAGQLKTLQNRSTEIFGMGLGEYFKKIGILCSAKPKTADTDSNVSKTNKIEKKASYHYLEVKVDGIDDVLLCVTTPRILKEGDYIEMCDFRC